MRSAGLLLYRFAGHAAEQTPGQAPGHAAAQAPEQTPGQTPAQTPAQTSEQPLATIEVWIAHMGGPFWSTKDAAAWSIPKGEHDSAEDPLAAAKREFAEEIGAPSPDLSYRRLGEFRQASGKIVTAFAAEFDGDLAWTSSSTFELEWPRGSGRMTAFPEVDGAGWHPLPEARVKLVAGQRPILDALEQSVAASNAEQQPGHPA